ncbi:MAG: hypothetical protein JRJ26_05730 [Deltaproteobacteria bacterium]|nr:hypothetical protein [Deltaproteobacteria bacterium]
MIYFLHQPAPRDYPEFKLPKGSPMCKVLADSVEELIRWGRSHGVRTIHISRSGKPHYDLWGPRLALCPHMEEMRRHRAVYRTSRLSKRGRCLGSPPG